MESGDGQQMAAAAATKGQQSKTPSILINNDNYDTINQTIQLYICLVYSILKEQQEQGVIGLNKPLPKLELQLVKLTKGVKLR